MKTGTGTFINRRTKTGKKSYDRFFFYVPTEVARDSTFPFNENEKVDFEIQGANVIVKKTRDQTPS